MSRPVTTPIQESTTAALVRRIGALILLLVVLVAVPVALVRLVGLPDVGMLSADAVGRLDERTVVHLGGAVFTVLWGWFAITAVAEIATVTRWRVRRTRDDGPAVLPPLGPTPGGLVRRLVRVALVSTAVVGTVAVHQPAPPTAAAAAAHVTESAPGPVAGPVAGESPTVTSGEVVADGRTTPYSLALQLGDPRLRERIIAANSGRAAPDGGAWTGGVFPAGMTVVVPRGLHDDAAPTSWRIHVVRPGESVYAIAAQVCGGDRLRLRPTVDAILARNLGRTMGDDRVFRDPSLIRPGWELEVPLTTGSVAATASADLPAVDVAGVAGADSPRTHVVERGESYWSIAEDTLDDDAGATDVLVAMRALRDANAPRFGRDDPNLIHPGDELELPAHPPLAAEPPTELPAGPPAELPAETPVQPGPTVPPTTTVQPEGPLEVVPVEPATAEVHDAHPSQPALFVPAATTSIPAATTTSVTPTTTPVTPATAPPATAPSTTELPTATVSTGRSPLTTSLGAALLVCAGALGLIESRRRHQLRSAPRDAVVLPPTVEAATTERLLRSLDSIHRAARLDLMLRCVGHQLAGSGRHVVGVLTRDDGSLDALLDRPTGVEPAAPLHRVDARRWSLPADVDTLDLTDDARLAGQPCPALVHLGTASDALTGAPAGDLLVDLEAIGLLSIDGHPEGVERVLLGIATSLAASPVGETLHLVTHGIDPAVHLGNLNAESAATVDEAIDRAVGWLGSTASVTGAAAGGTRTFELRARGTGGEDWEPVVVVSSGEGEVDDEELVQLTHGGGRGLAVVVGRAVAGAGLTMRAGSAGWMIERLGLTVVPVGLDLEQVHVVHDLLDAAERPLDTRPVDTGPVDTGPVDTGPGRTGTPAVSDAIATSAPPATARPFEEPGWALLVRLLGPVEVIGPDGTPVAFERSKGSELVAWLSVHRARPSRQGARAALWETAIRDASFANVVSDARRAMARAVTPATGEEWIIRTTNDTLPLHPLVLTDAEVLQARVDAARHLPPAEAIDVLRPGVALVRGLPFENAGFLWPDADGTTSSFVVLATGAATMLAQLALATGDVDTVFWATAQGLRVLPGHEELVALRMRAYALHGDLAGVRMEWEIYERTLHSDPWSFGDPSPKLIAIRRELLSS